MMPSDLEHFKARSFSMLHQTSLMPKIPPPSKVSLLKPALKMNIWKMTMQAWPKWPLLVALLVARIKTVTQTQTTREKCRLKWLILLLIAIKRKIILHSRATEFFEKASAKVTSRCLSMIYLLKMTMKCCKRGRGNLLQNRDSRRNAKREGRTRLNRKGISMIKTLLI